MPAHVPAGSDITQPLESRSSGVPVSHAFNVCGMTVLHSIRRAVNGKPNTGSAGIERIGGIDRTVADHRRDDRKCQNRRFRRRRSFEKDRR